MTAFYSWPVQWALLSSGSSANDRINIEGIMNCPVCANSLSSVKAGNVMVDVCVGGCGGMWFDNFELQKLDDPNEPGAEVLVNIGRRQDLCIDPAQRRKCPCCDDIVMMRHFYSPRRRVEVDECPSCGGFWLDAGELELVRQEHQNPAAQQAAVDEYVDAVSAAVLGPLASKAPGEGLRHRRIGQLFRFSSPLRFPPS